ncbi:MAG TPA: ATP-binding cassette domain-containing protein [Jiangellaceae bacterium]|nr:ATP-binding cassette domain-containing protein [Jiangellaceae bacterium]
MHIELHGLTKRYGPITAVEDLTFSPAPGRVTGFVGANGAGKSTTIRMLLGLTRPDAGAATIDGKAYAELRDPLRTVGAMVDPNVFHPNRTGRDALRVIARAAEISDSRVDNVLDRVGLTHAARRRVGGYSMGMRQRLALAAALLGEPGAVVLDEPANGLDPHGVHWLRGLIRGLAAEGRTVFVSSHLLAELAQTIDDVVIIAHGRLVTHEPMTALLGRANGGSLEDVYLNLTSTTPVDSSPGHLKELS